MKNHTAILNIKRLLFYIPVQFSVARKLFKQNYPILIKILNCLTKRLFYSKSQLKIRTLCMLYQNSIQKLIPCVKHCNIYDIICYKIKLFSCFYQKGLKKKHSVSSLTCKQGRCGYRNFILYLSKKYLATVHSTVCPFSSCSGKLQEKQKHNTNFSRIQKGTPGGKLTIAFARVSA